MFKKIVNWLLPKPEFVNVTLSKIKEHKETPKENNGYFVDRNYHHYVITEHTQQRMQQRKISYFEINLAFQYGKLNDKGNDINVKGIELNVSDLPKTVLESLNNNQIKAITRICPITLIVDLKDKILKTVYPNNKTNIKEKIISDCVRKGSNNKYSKRIKGKLIEKEKKTKKLAKKLRPYKEIEDYE